MGMGWGLGFIFESWKSKNGWGCVFKVKPMSMFSGRRRPGFLAGRWGPLIDNVTFPYQISHCHIHNPTGLGQCGRLCRDSMRHGENWWRGSEGVWWRHNTVWTA